MRKAFTLVLLLAGATACSPQQHQTWLRWFEEEPRAATRWAVNECGPLCTDDWDGDGVVEPDDRWTDATTDRDIFDVPDVEGEQDTAGIYWPWNELAECESGGNWSINTGNGYYGGLQFSLGSWHAAGGSGYPHEHSASEQIVRGEILQDMQGWNAWPTCARIIGLI